MKAPYYRLEIALCFRSHGRIIDTTAASTARVVGCVYDHEGQVHSCWNAVVNREEPYNPTDQGAAGDDTCSVCRDLLANMQRFFDLLESARKAPASEWMTVEEVARELKVSKSIVYRIIRNGELAAVDIVDASGRVARKGHYRVRRSSLEQYLEFKRVKSPQNPNPRLRPTHYPKVRNHLGL